MHKPLGSVAAAAWPCDAVVERSYEFLDGELSEDAERTIREHLDVCERCRRAVQHDRAFLDCLEHHARLDSAPAELRDRIACALDADQEPADPSRGDPSRGT